MELINSKGNEATTKEKNLLTVLEIATELNVKIEKIYCTFYQIKKKLRNKFGD